MGADGVGAMGEASVLWFAGVVGAGDRVGVGGVGGVFAGAA
jgi:hypothetical protein